MSLTDTSALPRNEKKVKFKDVDVYFFDRTQGFTSIPHEGGSTLGMEYKHTEHATLSIPQHDKLRKSSYLSSQGGANSSAGENSGEITPSDNQIDEHEAINCENEDWYFSTSRLKPEHRLTPAQRRLLLRESGLINIDGSESNTCKEIRDSRQNGGCNCDRICEPKTCSCSLANIQCFVDYDSYPCNCSALKCRNPSGRSEFSPEKVREHFVKTIRKLKRADT